jgi:hypothetical protein
MRALLIFVVLLASESDGFAGDAWINIKCLHADELDASIKYCSQNVLAEQSAKECSDKISQAWKDASKDLSLLAAGAQGNQNLGMENSDEKYQLAMERLEALIVLTEKNADILAQYPKVMVDNRSMRGPIDSLPCYKTVFQKIQDIVLDLDHKAAQGAKVLASTTELHKRLRQATNGVESSASSNAVLDSPGAKTSAPRPSRASKSRASTITGTKPKTNLNGTNSP